MAPYTSLPAVGQGWSMVLRSLPLPLPRGPEARCLVPDAAGPVPPALAQAGRHPDRVIFVEADGQEDVFASMEKVLAFGGVAPPAAGGGKDRNHSAGGQALTPVGGGIGFRTADGIDHQVAGECAGFIVGACDAAGCIHLSAGSADRADQADGSESRMAMSCLGLLLCRREFLGACRHSRKGADCTGERTDDKSTHQTIRHCCSPIMGWSRRLRGSLGRRQPLSKNFSLVAKRLPQIVSFRKNQLLRDHRFNGRSFALTMAG